MNEKIINVFFDANGLPYKDSERSVHFPIVGGAFLGASNTTKIRFYFDYIGDESTTWVSVAKLPNGKQGSKVLSVASDEDGNYAELELSNWYTQAKGDVYIALQGYQGGVEYSYDSETELYEIHGTPTIQTTGSIKLAINYAPIGDSPDYTDEYTTYQEILAALGDKANVDSVYTKAETDTALDGKVDKKETSGQHAYTHDGSAQGEIKVEIGSIGGAIVQRTENAQIIVPYTPSTDINATSKRYVDNTLTSGLATKQDRLVSGTNIKTINGQSVLGSGDLEVGGSGSAEWGAITGDIQDQTDLQDELQDIREVAEGKTNSFSVDTDTTGNSVFKSDDEVITATSFVDVNGNTINVSDLNVGDLVFTLNTNTNKYKDRWLIDKTLGTWGLIDADTPNLSGYATKTELSESVENLAQPYDSTVIYSVGDKVVYNDKLYSCLVNMSAAESWDSTHWVQITVASGFVDLDKAQVISGDKNHTGALQKNGVDVATIDQAFNVINASDIVSNTLTQAQFDLITNGKPTRIVGTFNEMVNAILYCYQANSSYFICQFYSFYSGDGYKVSFTGCLLQINNRTFVGGFNKIISTDNSKFYVYGKYFPTMPSNTGTFVLKCVDGTLTWVAE